MPPKKTIAKPVKLQPSEKVKSLWNDVHPLTAYELARGGQSDVQIMVIMEIGHRTFDKWKKTRPVFRQAIIRGRAAFKAKTEKKDGIGAFHRYMYDRLPARLQSIWDEVMACNAPGHQDARRLDALMSKVGRRARQELFIQAFTTSNFRVLTACRLIGIGRQDVDNWILTEPEFAALYQHVLDCKDDFFEDAFLNLIALGHPAAIIHAAKTKLSDRGYGEKMKVQHDHNHQHDLAIVKIDTLGYTLEEKKELLARIRASKAPQGEVIDATFKKELPRLPDSMNIPPTKNAGLDVYDVTPIADLNVLLDDEEDIENQIAEHDAE